MKRNLFLLLTILILPSLANAASECSWKIKSKGLGLTVILPIDVKGEGTASWQDLGDGNYRMDLVSNKFGAIEELMTLDAQGRLYFYGFNLLHGKVGDRTNLWSTVDFDWNQDWAQPHYLQGKSVKDKSEQIEEPDKHSSLQLDFLMANWPISLSDKNWPGDNFGNDWYNQIASADPIVDDEDYVLEGLMPYLRGLLGQVLHDIRFINRPGTHDFQVFRIGSASEEEPNVFASQATMKQSSTGYEWKFNSRMDLGEVKVDAVVNKQTKNFDKFRIEAWPAEFPGAGVEIKIIDGECN